MLFVCQIMLEDTQKKMKENWDLQVQEEQGIKYPAFNLLEPLHSSLTFLYLILLEL